MNIQNLKIIEIEEEESKLKSTKNTFNKVIEKNFTNLKNITEHQMDGTKK